jgi:hypothetical protein
MLWDVSLFLGFKACGVFTFLFPLFDWCFPLFFLVRNLIISTCGCPMLSTDSTPTSLAGTQLMASIHYGVWFLPCDVAVYSCFNESVSRVRVLVAVFLLM